MVVWKRVPESWRQTKSPLCDNIQQYNATARRWHASDSRSFERSCRLQRRQKHVGELNCRIEFYLPVVNMSLTARVTPRKLLREMAQAGCRRLLRFFPVFDFMPQGRFFNTKHTKLAVEDRKVGFLLRNKLFNSIR